MISITSILLGLGGKCLLNWTLVVIQRSRFHQSFLGVFSISLAIVDTALTLFVITVHLHTDGFFLLLGLKLTRFHVCLLVQILGQVYSTLQWPVVVLTSLDHFCSLTQRFQPNIARTKMARWFVHLSVTCLLWFHTVLYVFLLSDFNPVLEDVPYNQIYQCWVFNTSQILQIAMFLLLLLVFAAFHAGCITRKVKDQNTDQRKTLSRKNVVCQALLIFLNTWAWFLFFLSVILLLPVGIPTYLGLNVAWLSFLNSTLIAVLLCAVCPASQLAQGLPAVLPDSFCEWRFKFSLASEGSTCTLQIHTGHREEEVKSNELT
ncbi:probable G-protein coupled receptor 160 [Cheilinus undulatus]|uniref:probable G-protein coupled receptor 160 n=1 Tax=Cheilinus undulatus TaxID=241271 RepID=UPI001BD1E0C5|nr:probable G-protein coupled receptor 160 [Cheilinus undulatus]